MDARSFIACLLGATAAAAQVLQPTPPVDPDLPSRADEERAQDQVAQAPSQLDRELQRPDVAPLRESVGELTEVDPRNGTISVEQGGRETRLEVGENTRIELPGRPQTGLAGLVPGDDVRVSYDERGEPKTITLVPKSREESPGPPPSYPRSNPNAPNPSAPEPWNDRAPGDVPGNRIPW